MENSIEVWKDIKEYENYKVSNLGNVRSPKGLLKPGVQTSGYLVVSLYRNKKAKSFTVHRLVAQAFLTQAEGLDVVHHKNENKTDNRVENLEWCTQLDNVRYSLANKKRSKQVYQYTTDLELINIWESGAQAAESNSQFSAPGISQTCTGKRESHGGYTWSFTILNEWTTDIS